jgi:hypothetical protein
MRHLLRSVFAVGGLLLMSVAANAQYQYQQPRDYNGRDYNSRAYRGDRYRSPRAAIENTLAANRVSLNSMQSADQWNYYASETFPDFTPPSPETLFPWQAHVRSRESRYENASHDPVSFDTWWNAISPYLQGGR